MWRNKGLILPACLLSLNIRSVHADNHIPPPLCGSSKIPLANDPLRRTCLRQCLVEGDQIRPTFDEWAEFCRETSDSQDWDQDCGEYFCCLFGCSVYGGDRSMCRQAQGRARWDLLQEAKAAVLNSGITREQRCTYEKCHAYCARSALDTCKETQFKQKCVASNLQLYGCDINCGGASRMQSMSLAVLVSLFIAMTHYCG